MSVSESIALYGSAVWFDRALSTKCNRSLLRRTQRTAALRVIQGYRTVSTPAALVLAGSIPWDIRAEEARRLWQAGFGGSKTEERACTIAAWQAEWLAIPAGAPGAHVRDLVPNIQTWLDRPGGELDHFLTQVITGHGDFQDYLLRIGKSSSDKCLHCDLDAVDDPAHTLLVCPKWDSSRARVSERTGDGITRPIPDCIRNFVNIIVSSAVAWKWGASLAATILRDKGRLRRRPSAHTQEGPQLPPQV